MGMDSFDSSHINVRTFVPTTQARLDPATFNQSAQAAIRVAAEKGSAALVVTKREAGVASYLVVDGDLNAHQAAGLVGRALGAKVETVDETWAENFKSSYISVLEVDEDTTIGRYAQVGADHLEFARQVASSLSVGDWVAVTFRSPTKRENKRWTKWLDFNAGHGSGSHHSRDTNAVIVSLFAGSHEGHDHSNTILTNVAGSMVGLDLDTHPRAVKSSRRLLIPQVAALLSLGVIGYRSAISEKVASLDGDFWVGLSAWVNPTMIFMVFGIVVAACAIVWYLRFSDRWPSSTRGLWLDMTAGVFPAPKRGSRRIRAPHKETLNPDKTIKREEFAGDYPLDRWSFKAAASVFTSIAAPASGALSGQSQTEMRIVPPPLLERVGPIVGTAPDDGNSAHLFASQLQYGVALIGERGSGKSQLARALFGFDILEQMCPSGLPGFPGEKNSLIAFENKGPDGAKHYLDWAAALGQTAVLIDVADTNTFGIDFTATGGSMSSRANEFVDALVYAFEDGAIQSRARTSLGQIFTLALAVEATPEITASANENLEPLEPVIESGRSFVYYAYILSGGTGGGDALAKRLHAAIKAYAGDNPDNEAVVEAMTYGSYPFTKTPSERLKMFESSQTKLSQLAEMEGWFTPKRSKVTWHQVVTAFRPTVLNFGQSISGEQVAERNTKLMSSMALYTLQRQIERTCSGWEELKQWVSIYADELSLLAGSTAEPVVWFQDKGRSFGVRTIFATQRQTQLMSEVADMLLSMKTLIAYKQRNPDIIDKLVRILDPNGEDWRASDITSLPNFTAAVKTSTNVNDLPAFTLSVENFEAERAAFATRQGYQLPTTTEGAA